MVDIVPETINRIRLSNNDLILLYEVLKKINIETLDNNEKQFYNILVGRVEGRLKLKSEKICLSSLASRVEINSSTLHSSFITSAYKSKF